MSVNNNSGSKRSEKLAEWRGRVSQKLDDIMDDVKEIKISNDSFQKKLYVWQREFEKEYDDKERFLDERIRHNEKKIWCMIGAAAGISAVISTIAYFISIISGYP